MKVTILGTGAMGLRMGASLLKHGHQLTVWNRTPANAAPLVEQGAVLAETPRAAVTDADLVLSMVRDDPASRQVWLDSETGALEGMRRDAVAVESSTLTVEWVRELAAAFANTGIAFLDTPVSGSRPQAEAGQLIFLVGGNADTLAGIRDVLLTMGGAVQHAGDEPGSGAAVKLAVNALLGIQVTALSELLGFIKNIGLDTAKAAEIIGSTAVCSPYAKVAMGLMLADNSNPLFPVELVEKDLGYVHETGERHGARTPMSDAARTVFQNAMKAGFGEENLTSAVKLYVK